MLCVLNHFRKLKIEQIHVVSSNYTRYSLADLAMFRIVGNIHYDIVIPGHDFGVLIFNVCFIFSCLILALTLKAPNKLN